MKPWLFIIFLSFLPILANADMVVIGDSISVGSLIHPDIQWDVKKFQDYLSRDASPNLKFYSDEFKEFIPDAMGRIVPPLRHWEGMEEHKPNDFVKNVELTLRSTQVGKYIDHPVYAWPYLLGRKQGLNPQDIQLTAEGGNRSGDAKRQAARLLHRRKGLLPEKAYFFFAGNDMCSQKLEEDVKAAAEGWANRVFDGVKTLIEKGKPAATGTTIYIMPQLDLSQLIESDSVLNKKIYAFGKEMTCKEFRDFDPSTVDESKNINTTMALVLKYGLKSEKNLPSAVSECRSVLTIKKGAADYAVRFARLKLYLSEFEKAAAAIPARAEELLSQGKDRPDIKVVYLKSPAQFVGKAEYVANDCFHLSVQGQEELTRLLLKELESL